MSSSDNFRDPERWRLLDYITVVVQLLIPLAAILIVHRYPNASSWGADVKLSVVGLGLLAPIIIQQITISSAQKKNRSIEARLGELNERLSHLNPVLERAFMSGNDRIVRFALRRADELKTLVNYAVNNKRSGSLKPREYYEELDHLAQLVINDKKLHGRKFKGEIWAMTSFAPDEWINDDGYEDHWTDTLKSMVDMGIQTRRICIIPSQLLEAIGSDTFSEPLDIPQFSGFMSLLKDYYSNAGWRKNAQHYIIRETTNPELTQIAGFFAIRLTGGEMHILTGETIDNLGSLTAEALFNEDEIKSFSMLCNKFMTNRHILENVINEQAEPAGFLAYLSSNDVNLNDHN